MQYRELVLEPVETMNDATQEAGMARGGEDPALTFFLDTQTDSLDTRLIQLIKTLDR